MAFTQNACALVKKITDPTPVSLNYDVTSGYQVIAADTPSLFYDNNCGQTVTSCTLVGSPANVVISSSAPFAINAYTNVVGGYQSSIQVSCSFSGLPAVTSGILAFTETCSIVPKTVGDKVFTYSSSGTSIILFYNIATDLFDGSECSTVESCTLVTSETDNIITVDGSGSGPYRIKALDNSKDGYKRSVQVQCKFIDGSDVQSIPFTVTENAAPLVAV